MSVTMMTTPLRRDAPASSPFDDVSRFLRTAKGSLFAVFVPLLVLAARAAGWQAALPHVAIAVGGACLAELMAVGLGKAAWRWPTSALLSGLIVAFVLGPETPPILVLALGALASASKHIVTTGRGHIFNPAALALFVSVPLFATDQSWWGALPDLPWPWLLVLLVGGAFVVDRVNKFPLVLSFLGIYFGLFTLVAFLDPMRVSEMFRTPFVQAALFLAFFMLTDPPTSPSRYTDQVWIGALVAAAGCVAQLLGAGQSFLLIGLLVGNLALALRRGLAPTAISTSVATPIRTNRATPRGSHASSLSARAAPDRSTTG
jgi:Na+-translocating ferredoxin:NAD+ oxidoreductase RnfD subunit